MKIFWKVSRNDFNSFISYVIGTYNNFDNTTNVRDFIIYYDVEDNNDKYLYFSIEDGGNCKDGQFHFSYCNYYDEYYDILIKDCWEYKGEFISRSEKLKRLNTLSDD